MLLFLVAGTVAGTCPVSTKLPSGHQRIGLWTSYHSPDEKPPGGMRFLLITWPPPFSDGTVVLISAAPFDLLYPSPVTGLPLWLDPLSEEADEMLPLPLLCPLV
uniref:Putative secreted protein n=1 Tax=Anopheles marajoara TaxID=58244 RepID=A0A2M4C8G0_9DIPT